MGCRCDDKLYLSLLIGPLAAVPAPPEVVDAFLGAQVTVTAGQRTGFQLTFAVSRRSLLMTTLIPAGYFDPGIRVILVITVNGVPTPVIDGLITRQEVGVSDTIGQPSSPSPARTSASRWTSSNGRASRCRRAWPPGGGVDHRLLLDVRDDPARHPGAVPVVPIPPSGSRCSRAHTWSTSPSSRPTTATCSTSIPARSRAAASRTGDRRSASASRSRRLTSTSTPARLLRR